MQRFRASGVRGRTTLPCVSGHCWRTAAAVRIQVVSEYAIFPAYSFLPRSQAEGFRESLGRPRRLRRSCLPTYCRGSASLGRIKPELGTRAWHLRSSGRVVIPRHPPNRKPRSVCHLIPLSSSIVLPLAVLEVLQFNTSHRQCRSRSTMSTTSNYYQFKLALKTQPASLSASEPTRRIMI